MAVQSAAFCRLIPLEDSRGHRDPLLLLLMLRLQGCTAAYFWEPPLLRWGVLLVCMISCLLGAVLQVCASGVWANGAGPQPQSAHS